MFCNQKVQVLQEHLQQNQQCGDGWVMCPRKKCNKIERARDLNDHKMECYRREHECEHCGMKDSYVSITGDGGGVVEPPQTFHYMTCDKFPETCTCRALNDECGDCDTKMIRKDMKHMYRHFEDAEVKLQRMFRRKLNSVMRELSDFTDELLVSCPDLHEYNSKKPKKKQGAQN